MARTMPSLFSFPGFKSAWETPRIIISLLWTLSSLPRILNVCSLFVPHIPPRWINLELLLAYTAISSLMVGQVVTLNLMQTVSGTGPREPDTLLAGKLPNQQIINRDNAFRRAANLHAHSRTCKWRISADM